MASDGSENEVTEVNSPGQSVIEHPSANLPVTSVLEAVLQHAFSRPGLLEQALTHTSQSHERSPVDSPVARQSDNEQLEFLGDAVLGFVTAEELCRRYPDFREGQLSKLRAHLVSQKHLIKVSRELKLGDYLRLGKGEEKSGGRNKPALLVDALEAVIAAIYLDGGLAPARNFVIRRILDPELQSATLGGASLLTADYKSALQEKLQAEGRAQPEYLLVKAQGPEHRKTFLVEARFRLADGELQPDYVARGEGPTKKSAEQESARQLLELLDARN